MFAFCGYASVIQVFCVVGVGSCMFTRVGCFRNAGETPRNFEQLTIVSLEHRATRTKRLES